MKAPHSQNVIGILSLCGGVFIFSLQDAILKGMSGDHAVTLAIVLRSIVGLPLLLAMVAYANGLSALKTKRWKLLIARGLILLTSYTSYYMAFPALPLAEAVALSGIVASLSCGIAMSLYTKAILTRDGRLTSTAVLRMLADKKISVEQAEKLLAALSGGAA